MSRTYTLVQPPGADLREDGSTSGSSSLVKLT
jgi:hypothetical protein